MIGGCLGQRQFGCSAGALGIFQLRLQRRAICFVLRQCGLARGEFLFQPGQRFGGVAG